MGLITSNIYVCTVTCGHHCDRKYNSTWFKCRLLFPSMVSIWASRQLSRQADGVNILSGEYLGEVLDVETW